MSGICRVGVDSAGGVILGVNQNGTVFANGKAVCKEGNTATCGHPASGSIDVFVG